MLWVDANFVTVPDLISLDAEVAEIIAATSIQMEGDNGLITRAKADAQANLSRYMSLGGLTKNDLAFRDVNILPYTMSPRYDYAGFEQLVVSGDSEAIWSPIKIWLANVTLLRLYRAATNKESDRYSDRYDLLENIVRTEYWPNFRRRGLPIAFNPLSCPGAVGMRNGVFSINNLATVADVSGTSDENIDIAVTWVGSRYVSPTSKHNAESFRSSRVSLQLTDGNLASVDIIGLLPPNGQQPPFTLSSCRYTPGTAVGWNVWAGRPDETAMYRQNATVLPLTTHEFTFTGNPVFSGEQLDIGQFEDAIIEMRIHMERA